jgi:GAF domain-containing protein
MPGGLAGKEGGGVRLHAARGLHSSLHCTSAAPLRLTLSAAARGRAPRGRFMRNAFVVHPPHVRFYAGCPLLSSTGHRLGSLCIVDTAPRRQGADKLRMLSGFADLAVRQLEKRVALRRQLTSSRKRAP